MGHKNFTQLKDVSHPKLNYKIKVIKEDIYGRCRVKVWFDSIIYWKNYTYALH